MDLLNLSLILIGIVGINFARCSGTNEGYCQNGVQVETLQC